MRILVVFLLFSHFLAHSQTKLTITDAIRMGKLNNPLAKLYKLNLDIEKAELITSGLRPNILLNQQSVFLVNQSNLDAIKANQTLFLSPYGDQLWFQATKQFQLNGKRQSKLEFQNRVINYAENDINERINSYAYHAALRWVEVWHAKLKLDILKDAQANVDTLLAINQIRRKKNEITEIDLARSQIISDQHYIQLNAAEQVYLTESRKLAFLTGFTSSVDIDLDANFFFADVFESVDSLNKTANLNRPDLLSQVAQTKVSLSNIKLQKSLSVPNLEFGLIFNPQNTQPYVGTYLQMPLPIFDRNQGGIQKSKIQYEQRLAGVNVLKKQIEMELSYTLQEYETNKENSESFRIIEEDADVIINSVLSSYLKGETPLVDYLVARQNWFEIQKEYYETLYQYRISYLNVLYTSGMLLKE